MWLQGESQGDGRANFVFLPFLKNYCTVLPIFQYIKTSYFFSYFILDYEGGLNVFPVIALLAKSKIFSPFYLSSG